MLTNLTPSRQLFCEKSSSLNDLSNSQQAEILPKVHETKLFLEIKQSKVAEEILIATRSLHTVDIYSFIVAYSKIIKKPFNKCYGYLAKIFHCCIRTVQNAVYALEDLGFITVIRSYNKNLRRRNSNMITLTAPLEMTSVDTPFPCKSTDDYLNNNFINKKNNTLMRGRKKHNPDYQLTLLEKLTQKAISIFPESYTSWIKNIYERTKKLILNGASITNLMKHFKGSLRKMIGNKEAVAKTRAYYQTEYKAKDTVQVARPKPYVPEVRAPRTEEARLKGLTEASKILSHLKNAAFV